MSKFLDSLKPGDLVIATNFAVRVHHIIKLEGTAASDDIAGLPRQLSKERRAARIADIRPDRYHMWNARGLCGVRGEHAFYGNYSRYYWQPLHNPDLKSACKACQKEWKKLSEPEIAGYDRTGAQDDPWPWSLPFGWREVSAEGHPWERDDKAEAEAIKDGTGKIVGRYATEIKRWQRGPRIVRLVIDLLDGSYEARVWLAGDDPDKDRWKNRGPLKYARESCHKLMAVGGY